MNAAPVFSMGVPSVLEILIVTFILALVVILLNRAKSRGGNSLVLVSSIVVVVFIFLAAAVMAFMLVPHRSSTRGPVVTHRAPTSRLAPVRTARSIPTPPSQISTSHNVEVVAQSSRRDRTAGGGAAWLPEVEEKFEADQYSSVNAAARALARRMPTYVDRVIGVTHAEISDEDEGPTMIQIMGTNLDEPWDEQVLQNAAEVIRRLFPAADVDVNADKPATSITKLEDRAVAIEMSKRMTGMQQPQAPWDDRRVERTGVLSAHLRGIQGQVENSVRFIEKPWVDDMAMYLSSHPDRNDVLALSSEFCSSAQDARYQSQVAAAKMLAPMVEMSARNYALENGSNSTLPQSQDVVSELLRTIQAGGFVRDQFSQRLSTSNGDVWRHAILVEPREDLVDQIALSQVSTRDIVVSHEKRRQKSRLASIVGLFVCLCGIYWVLETATKGYYTWHIVIVVAVALTVAILFVA